MEEVVMIIASHGSYIDVFEIFLHLKNKYWKDCPYKIVFSTTVDVEYDGVICIKNDVNSSLSSRVRTAMNAVRSQYYIFMCEDMFINSKVNQNDIVNIFKIMKRTNSEYLRIRVMNNHKKNFDEYNAISYRAIMKNDYYAFSLMACAFTKLFAETELFINENESGWDIEQRLYSKFDPKSDAKHEKCIVLKDNLFHLEHCVSKGKWITENVRKVVKKNPEIYITNREFSNRKECLKRYMKTMGYSVVPVKYIKIVKRILTRLGFKFVIN